MRSSFSNTVTACPMRRSCCAAARPAGPEPTTATRKPESGDAGERHDPAFLERLVGDRLLDVADGDGLLDQAEHARRLAGRRAEATRELGEVVRRVQRERRVPPAAFADERRSTRG